ncbi:hypothetical protein AVEN_135780-1 [Araneus ventricosus]|uniref:Uncharacterized protein n=1 Tax=Araneus ventricosus TaxID=182803 RepID=A0A4Y2CDE9_ARAVE|nr:hypothetical protein AVEN_135780-1 [Araneus ventricosus]
MNDDAFGMFSPSILGIASGTIISIQRLARYKNLPRDHTLDNGRSGPLTGDFLEVVPLTKSMNSKQVAIPYYRISCGSAISYPLVNFRINERVCLYARLRIRLQSLEF